jgi:ParB-like chromosome segregation protein Spo0J
MSTNPEKYRLLPELNAESFAALKADIAERGVVVPVLVDEFGAIIDGHNRARTCRELGINNYPVEVRSGLSEADKRTLTRKLNAPRRHLSRQQVRQLIADQSRDTPDWADRRISRELGVDHKTVRCSAWASAKSPRHPFSVTPSRGERRSMTRGATARHRQLDQWHTEKR